MHTESGVFFWFLPPLSFVNTWVKWVYLGLFVYLVNMLWKHSLIIYRKPGLIIILSVFTFWLSKFFNDTNYKFSTPSLRLNPKIHKRYNELQSVFYRASYVWYQSYLKWRIYEWVCFICNWHWIICLVSKHVRGRDVTTLLTLLDYALIIMFDMTNTDCIHYIKKYLKNFRLSVCGNPKPVNRSHFG